MGRFDISFKTLAESSPMTLLRQFGHVPIPPGTKVMPVDRELVMAIKTVDHAFLLENADDRWLEHFEAETSLSSADLVQIARRATLLAIKNDAPVWTTVVLLSRRHAPADLPDCVVEERGSIAVTARPRFIRLWEVHPEPVLAEIPIEALPIIGGMRATRAQLGEAMQRLTEVRDRELRSRLFSELATWASLNYNEIEINEIRARSRMTLEELFLMSPFSEMLLKEAKEKALREGLQEGRQEGRQEGLHEGQIEGARSSLLSLADIRFPGLITAADVEPIADLDTIGRIFRGLAIASDRDAANAAVQELRASHS